MKIPNNPLGIIGTGFQAGGLLYKGLEALTYRKPKEYQYLKHDTSIDPLRAFNPDAEINRPILETGLKQYQNTASKIFGGAGDFYMGAGTLLGGLAPNMNIKSPDKRMEESAVPFGTMDTWSTDPRGTDIKEKSALDMGISDIESKIPNMTNKLSNNNTSGMFGTNPLGINKSGLNMPKNSWFEEINPTMMNNMFSGNNGIGKNLKYGQNGQYGYSFNF